MTVIVTVASAAEVHDSCSGLFHIDRATITLACFTEILLHRTKVVLEVSWLSCVRFGIIPHCRTSGRE